VARILADAAATRVSRLDFGSGVPTAGSVAAE